MRILHLAESAKKKEEEQEEVFKQLDSSPDKARLDRLFDEQATKNFCQQHSMKPWKCHDDKLSCRNPLQVLAVCLCSYTDERYQVHLFKYHTPI